MTPRPLAIKYLRQKIKENTEGVWIPKHDDKGHHYYHQESDTLVDSVTTKIILDKGKHFHTWIGRMAGEYMRDNLDMELMEAGLLPDMDQMVKRASLAYKQKRDDAGDVGSEAHRAVEDYVDVWLETDEQPEDIREFVDDRADRRVFAAARSAEDSFNKHNVVPLASEIVLGSLEYNVAGTVDLLALMDDKLVVWDWKTSNRVYDTNALQAATYKQLVEDMTDLTFTGAYVVHISKSHAKFKLYKVNNCDEAFAAAKSIYAVYDWKYSDTDKLVDVNKNVVKI